MQKVAVKWKTIKDATGIMNKNRFHLLDCTRNPVNKNDLSIIAIKCLPAFGKKVTVTGTLRCRTASNPGRYYIKRFRASR